MPKISKLKIQELVADYTDRRAEWLAHDRAAAEAKKCEDAVYQQLLAAVQALGVAHVETSTTTVHLEYETKPTITNWPELCAFIHKHKAFELIQKRLAVAAVRERYDAKKTIPGVSVAEEPVLKFSRP